MADRTPTIDDQPGMEPATRDGRDAAEPRGRADERQAESASPTRPEERGPEPDAEPVLDPGWSHDVEDAYVAAAEGRSEDVHDAVDEPANPVGVYAGTVADTDGEISQEVGVGAGVVVPDGTIGGEVTLDYEGRQGESGSIGVDISLGGEGVDPETGEAAEGDLGLTAQLGVTTMEDRHVEAELFVGLEAEADDAQALQVGGFVQVEGTVDENGEGGQVGIDVGVTAPQVGPHVDGELAATANIDAQVDDDGDGAQVGLDVGLNGTYIGHDPSGDAGPSFVTGEVVATANVDGQNDSDGSGGGQIGLDVGFAAELGDDRGEFGLTLNNDLQQSEDGSFEQQGVDLGLMVETSEGDRLEAGATVNADTHGGDLGLYAENAEGERIEAGVTGQADIELTDDTAVGTATVGLFAEGEGGRGEISVGVAGEVGLDGVDVHAGIDLDGDGDLDEFYGLDSTAVSTHVIEDPDGSGGQAGVDLTWTAEDGGPTTGLTANLDHSTDADGGGEVGFDLGVVRHDDGTTTETGLTVDLDLEQSADGWQAGLDVGLGSEDREGGQTDNGISFNLDGEDDGQNTSLQAEIGIYGEDESGARTEVGLGAGHSTEETLDGFDAGVGITQYSENEDGTVVDKSLEIEYSTSTDPDGVGGEQGVQIVIENNFGDDFGGEMGAGVNLDHDADPDGSGGQFGIDAGLTLETWHTGSELDRNTSGEVGVTANFDVDEDPDGAGGQAGVDVGFHLEGTGATDWLDPEVAGYMTSHSGYLPPADTSSDERAEAGATANFDTQLDESGEVAQQGVDLGFFAEFTTDQHEGAADGHGPTEWHGEERYEAGFTVNDDVDGNDIGFYAEGHDSDSSGRSEAGITHDTEVVADDGSTTTTHTVGIFAEGEERWERNVGYETTTGETVGSAVGVDTDGDGLLDHTAGVEASAGADADGVHADGAAHVGDHSVDAGVSFGDGSASADVTLSDGQGETTVTVGLDAGSFGDGVGDAGAQTDAALDQYGDAVEEDTSELGDAVDESLDGLGDNLGGPADDALDAAGDTAEEVIDSAGEVAGDMADDAGDTAADVADAVAGFFGA